MSGRTKPPLSELENTVMNVVWEHPEATADFVRRQIESSQPIKDSTVRTILRRLEEKGYVRHRTEGRTFLYSPTIESQCVAADAVRGIIDRFCQGSVESLLVGLVNRDVVTPEKLQELAKRIANAKKNAVDVTEQKSNRRKGK